MRRSMRDLQEKGLPCGRLLFKKDVDHVRKTIDVLGVLAGNRWPPAGFVVSLQENIGVRAGKPQMPFAEVGNRVVRICLFDSLSDCLFFQWQFCSG